MPCRANTLSRLALLAALLAGSEARTLVAQEAPSRPWTLTAAFTGLRTGGTGGVVYGPELGIRRDFGPRWGVELRASLPFLPTNDGAAALDLGPTLTFTRERSEFGLTAGATAFLVGDRGELADAGIGGFVDGHATAWLSKNVGAVVRANVRVSGGGNAYPGLSAGLAVRF
ncbi:MAG: hypothetical protein ABJC36_10410 [Gemmatimonadales bacterium]